MMGAEELVGLGEDVGGGGAQWSSCGGVGLAVDGIGGRNPGAPGYGEWWLMGAPEMVMPGTVGEWPDMVVITVVIQGYPGGRAWC